MLKACVINKFKIFFEKRALTYSDEYNRVQGVGKYKNFIKFPKNGALSYICQYNTM